MSDKQTPTALPRLTNAQFRFLELASMYTPPTTRHDTSGVIAKGATLKTAARLEQLGYVEYVAHGPEIDSDERWPERAIYAITDAGRAYLKAVQPS